MNLYDIGYGIGAAVSAPIWLIKPSARRKVFHAIGNRMGNVSPRPGSAAAVMIHAVSLGEINSIPELIRRLRIARPGMQFIVSTTTETGFARGQELYGKADDVTLLRFPLDFSWAVGKMLDQLRPSAVVLMELEVWPNFLRQCHQRRIPVVVVNGRVTTTSFARYQMIGPLARWMFGGISRICAQDQTYADRFAALGVAKDRIAVTGTMKFDTAQVTAPPGAAELAAAVGLKPAEMIWVCGSTGPGEETILLACYRKLTTRFPALRLILVPRRPQRFNEVADLITASGFACVRRSQPSATPSGTAVILGDTMGELRGWYSLANAVFVGRSLVDLGPGQHGSDMMEPAALAKPVAVGPFTANFAEPMKKFLAAGAMKVVSSREDLERVTTEMLDDAKSAADLGRRAQEVVIASLGATDRHVKTIVEMMEEKWSHAKAQSSQRNA